MMLGREVMLPIDLMIGDLEQKYDSAAEYIVKLKTILKQVHTLARDTLESSQMRQKRDYDLKLKTQSYDFIYLFIWGFTSLSTLYRSYHDG